MDIHEIRKIFEQEKGKYYFIQSQIKQGKKAFKKIKREIKISKKAASIIRAIAQNTQKQIQFHISELITMALRSVFPNPYVFHLDFLQKRNKTECRFFFERNGTKINPLTEAGGGVVDVAAFALRVAMWALSKPTYRNTLILDEPFKNINDKTRETHRKIADLVKLLSDKLHLQFIIITMIPEFEEVADRVFELSLKNGETKINIS